jgi:cellulose synthase operon protein C
LPAKGDVRQGEALLQAALERDPASLPALAMLLNLYDRQRRTQEAVQRISTLVYQHPQNAGLHFLLAVGYFRMKELEKSEVSLRRAITLDPKTPDAYTLLADIDLAKGAVEKAKMDFRAAIDANPRNMTNYRALEMQYEKEGNWEEAKKLCEKAHEVDSASPLVANDLASLYLEHGGDVNTALSLAQMAKQKMPNSPNIADTLGWAYYKLGSVESAIGQLKECTQKAPDNSVCQYHLAMAYIGARQFRFAQRSLQMALKANPDFPYAANAKAALDKVSKELR